MSIRLVTAHGISGRVRVLRRDVLLGAGSVLSLSPLIGVSPIAIVSGSALAQNPKPQPSKLSATEIGEIARAAYIYAYPMIIMEMTRRVGTNVADSSHFGKSPMNQFGNMPAFPDASFTDVVRPNADTLYSFMWFDLSVEPLVISAPDSGDRYYLLPMLDMWTDVFASPGKRTTGTEAQLFVLCGPDWKGPLPEGTSLIRSPTAAGWIVGRTQTNGKSDYAAVHAFQAGLAATPLSHWGKPYQPPAGAVVPEWDMKTPPTEQVEKLTPSEYFSLFAELMKLNPPHANDYPILGQIRRLGIEPGKLFEFDALPSESRQALTQAGPAALKLIKSQFLKAGTPRQGWRTNLSSVGTYGTDYLARAGVAFAGLGANTVEDAVYPTAVTDADGQPFDSAKRYVLHFKRDEIPPVNAFWSLTMYNDRQAFAANPIDRYAIGDRDDLKINADGSLDIYIQRKSPGKAKEANWLPAPAQGTFTMNMRLYWPKAEVIEGNWKPPGVKRL